MYAHDATARPRVSSRLAPQLPERPARVGPAPSTPVGSRPDSPTKKPATRRPVGAGLLDPVAEARRAAPTAAAGLPDAAVHGAQAQPQQQAQSPPPLPAPRATSPVATSFSMSPIAGPTVTSPRARAPTSLLSPAHASSGVPRRHASVAGDHDLPHRACSGPPALVVPPTLTATASFHHARNDSFQSTTSSAASAAPSNRTTATTATAAASLVRSGARRARKFVSHWSDATSSSFSSSSPTDRRRSVPPDGLLESYRLRGAQLHAEAQGLAEQLRVVQRQRDELRAQLDAPGGGGGPTAAAAAVAARRTGGEDRAEARRRDRELRAHLAAATAAAKRGELVLADVQADADARLEAAANQMAAETVRAKVLEMQVRSFGLAPASEVPGALETIEVGGDLAKWRKVVEQQAREIEEGAAKFWVAMHDAEVTHARAVAELAEYVLVQAGGKPKEIRRGEFVDPGKLLARIRKEREADEARWKEDEAKFKLEQEEKDKERVKNEAGADEPETDKSVRTKLHDSAQGDDLAATATATSSLTARNSTDAVPAQDAGTAKGTARTPAPAPAPASSPPLPAAADGDERVSLMAMARQAETLKLQAAAAPAAGSKEAPMNSSATESRAVITTANEEPVSSSRSHAAPTTTGTAKPTTVPATANVESTAAAAPKPVAVAAPSSPTKKPLPVSPRVTDPILQALDPGFKKPAADAPTVAKPIGEDGSKPAPSKETRPAVPAAALAAKPPPVEPVPVTKPAAAAAAAAAAATVAPTAKPAPAAQPPPRVSVDDAVRQTALLAQLMQATRAGGTTTHVPKPAATTVHAPKPAAVKVEPDRGSNKVAPAPVQPVEKVEKTLVPVKPVEKVDTVELPPLAPVEDVLGGAGFLDLDLDLGLGLGFDM
ncbi:hypothetical protein GGF31_008558 [Allomyces arbusculus]|nr:hypothetical protein GGF31_008558 [Allomyces arbusculus]